MTTPLQEIRRNVGKHQIPTYVTPGEARRFEALAAEHYDVLPAQLLRRLLFDELVRTRGLDLTAPYPDSLT